MAHQAALLLYVSSCRYGLERQSSATAHHSHLRVTPSSAALLDRLPLIEASSMNRILSASIACRYSKKYHPRSLCIQRRVHFDVSIGRDRKQSPCATEKMQLIDGTLPIQLQKTKTSGRRTESAVAASLSSAIDLEQHTYSQRVDIHHEISIVLCQKRVLSKSEFHKKPRSVKIIIQYF